MSLLGTAALAMWWNIAPDVRSEFEDWHSHEHFPERLAIPGFRRGSRWRSATGGQTIFVMYELENYRVLSSAHYLARLNAPTPWSTKMMPHHKDMVRSQSHVLESLGGCVAACALTVRLSPEAGREADLQASLRSLMATLVIRPGLTGAHLLRHETPPIAQTTEQKIRGASDRTADWVIVACGYDRSAMEDLANGDLAAPALTKLGAAERQIGELFTLSYSSVPADANQGPGSS
jgi:hypothetical protein